MNIENFSKPLITWYSQHKRDLPFRKTSDPYKIWVSEIMAQQTQITTMIPYYQRWIMRWPTIDALAKASDQEVKKAWEGLGYYRRAENLLKGAQHIVDKHDGQFPSNPLEIREIPGIGDYTTGAIASIAFNQSVPAIDGNVIRVMTRLTQDDRDFLKPKNKSELSEQLKSMMSGVDASDFTQGLMELGALICTPTSPKCAECPLRSICQSYKDGTQDQYPVKHRKTKSITLEFDTFVVINDGQLLVSTQHDDGLMTGLVRLPQLPSKTVDVKKMTFEFSTKHVYSHRIWLMDVYSTPTLDYQGDWQWIPLIDINQYSWATAHKKILKSILNKKPIITK